MGYVSFREGIWNQVSSRSLHDILAGWLATVSLVGSNFFLGNWKIMGKMLVPLGWYP